MIYRVVIIDNGNQITLTKQGDCTPIFEVDGEGVWCDEVKAEMIDALEKLQEVFK